MMNKKILPHLALLCVALIYGSNYTIAGEVLKEGYIEPLGFILMRVGFAACFFWLVTFFSPKEDIASKDFRLLALCGLFGVAINQMFFFSGLKFTVPINAALIMTTTPLLVLLMASLILHETITKRKLIGIFIGLLGAVVVIAYGQTLNFRMDYLKGDLMILINAISYGIYLVLVKSLMDKYQPLTVIKWVFTFGLLMVTPFGLRQVMVVEWGNFPAHIWWAVGFVLLFTTCFAYLLNAFALKKLPASVVGIYIFLQPVIATVVAVLTGRDQLDTFKIFAALLIFAGVWLVSNTPRTVGK